MQVKKQQYNLEAAHISCILCLLQKLGHKNKSLFDNFSSRKTNLVPQNLGWQRWREAGNHRLKPFKSRIT
jgi:hypothetical protein